MENSGTKSEISKSEKNTQKSDIKPKEQIYYSGLTIFLLFALIQVGWSVIINFSKAVSFNSKMSTLEKLKEMSVARNEQLQSEIKAYSEISNLEGIARNSLKMASEDEVLILINEPQTEETPEKGFLKKKNDNKKLDTDEKNQKTKVLLLKKDKKHNETAQEDD